MEYDVEGIPQETTNTCWAASLAMLIQFLSGGSRPPASQPVSPFRTGFTPRSVALQTGGALPAAYENNAMITPNFRDNFTAMANRWGLVVEFSFNNPQPDEWERLLRQNGPYYVVRYNDPSEGPYLHAVIVAGITGDQLSIVDPWPVGEGSRYTMPRSELRLTGTVLHGGHDTSMLQPAGRGGGG